MLSDEDGKSCWLKDGFDIFYRSRATCSFRPVCLHRASSGIEYRSLVFWQLSVTHKYCAAVMPVSDHWTQYQPFIVEISCIR